MKKIVIAHKRESDGEIQPLETHLFETSKIARDLADKLGGGTAGELVGLMHDFGKYSSAFQVYLSSAVGEINPDADDYVDAKGLKGKIDHSSAGAQWIWREISSLPVSGAMICAQILALCVASHHSGLINCLDPDGNGRFKKRIEKPDCDTHLEEAIANADSEVIKKAKELSTGNIMLEMMETLRSILTVEQGNQPVPDKIKHFYLGVWTRFLFSCLIDADRLNSADFESPDNKKHRDTKPNWNTAIERVENFIAKLEPTQPVDNIRRQISESCQKRTDDPAGIYTLTVPTGGGKTYSTLRYAVHHAQKRQCDRIIYIIPYTSIIEQNASAIREVLEYDGDIEPWVLEQHSNLEPEQQTWRTKLVSENWDSPVVLTTMVQFLEALFSGGTRGVRRMHQLANSVLIFDEIQTLPINCVHLFCNALNFLTQFADTTAVLCTATQPVLDKLKAPDKGQLALAENHELIGDSAAVNTLFEDLQRVRIHNQVRSEGWNSKQITELAISETKDSGSCLIIVNTKAWAKQLYQAAKEVLPNDAVFHLSTHQCAAHRKSIICAVKQRLKDKLPVLCVSTQLIEAGVDVDFGSVVRFLAGLDSIAQAAGRCNRNGGNLSGGNVYIVNPDKENINVMTDIKVGQDMTRKILREFPVEELLSPAAITQYFKYFFFDRSPEMAYSLTSEQAGRNDTLLNLLSDNSQNVGRNTALPLKQSFMTAGKAFKAIDAPTEAVIVPYGQGKEVISELCAVAKDFDAQRYFSLLKQAQKYSVNLFPNVRRQLEEVGGLRETQQGDGVFYVIEQCYDDAFGLNVDASTKMELLHA